MAFLSRAFKAAFSVLSIRTSSREDPPPAKRSVENAFEKEDKNRGNAPNKRRRLEDNGAEPRHTSEGPFEEQSSTSIHDTSNVESRAQSDRLLMPPPSMLGQSSRKPRPQTRKKPRVSLDLAENASQATRSSRTGRHEVLDEYDMEEARRKAAATELPPNSGIWETGERELFFHLSYRGFEPLLPKNWMIDFPTLPLPVFAHQEEDVPIIECHRSTQFRAIRALRELIDTGTQIRDRTVSSHALGTELRAEPILEKAVNKYISWALKDTGFSDTLSKRTIPVHAIATLQLGEKAHHVIEELATQMHLLATRHRAAINIQTSIERQFGPEVLPDASEETRILPDTDPDEPSLPIIYGIMIASSVLAVFTLNSHVPFPPRLIRKLVLESQANIDPEETGLTPEEVLRRHPNLTPQLASYISRNAAQISTNGLAAVNDDDDSGIRYIASFDFSDAVADVWNAFVIAIIAMQIRKAHNEVHQTWTRMRQQQQAEAEAEAEVDVETIVPQTKSHTPQRTNVANGTFGTPGTHQSLDVGEESWLSNIDGVTSPYMGPGTLLPATIHSPPSEISSTSRRSRGRTSATGSGTDTGTGTGTGKRKRGVRRFEDDDDDPDA